MVKHDSTLLDCCNLRNNIQNKWSRLLKNGTMLTKCGKMKTQQFPYFEILLLLHAR